MYNKNRDKILGRRMKKKKLNVLIIFPLVLFVLLIALYILFNSSLKLPLLGCRYIDGNDPNLKWNCTSVLDGKIADWKLKIFEEECKEIGGIIDYYPHGWSPRQNISCVIPFSDWGDACRNSDDCMGGCEYLGDIPDFCKGSDGIEYICEEDIYGTCTAFEQTRLLDWTEVKNNTLLYYFIIF